MPVTGRHRSGTCSGGRCDRQMPGAWVSFQASYSGRSASDGGVLPDCRFLIHLQGFYSISSNRALDFEWTALPADGEIACAASGI